MLLSFSIIFGLAIGSFLNSVIYRLEQEMPVFQLKSRSVCPNCKKKLRIFELIPLISFIIQKGRCLNCNQKISWQYPLVEISTALLFLISIFYFLPSDFLVNFDIFKFLNYIYVCLTISLLILIFVFDFKYYIIPNQFIYSLIVLTTSYLLITSYSSLIPNSLFEIHKSINSSFYAIDSRFKILDSSLISTLLTTTFFSSVFLFFNLISSGRLMGMGDVKLVFFIGLFLGWPKTLLALFLSFFIGLSLIHI